MSDISAVAIAVVTNLAAILMATAVLIASLKGNFKALNEKVDGHLSRMLDAVKSSSKVEGKVDALMQKSNPAIVDRRKEPKETKVEREEREGNE